LAHIVIVGNGIAGTTAAIKIRSLSQDDITMISDETAFPYARTALMYVGMGQLLTEDIKLYPDWFWQKNNIHLIQRKVKNIDTTSQVVYLSDHQSLRYDKLILATGSSPKLFDFMQSEIKGVHFFTVSTTWRKLKNPSLMIQKKPL
jgi:NAD(P)H-nitrite reductase large subunit